MRVTSLWQLWNSHLEGDLGPMQERTSSSFNCSWASSPSLSISSDPCLTSDRAAASFSLPSLEQIQGLHCGDGDICFLPGSLGDQVGRAALVDTHILKATARHNPWVDFRLRLSYSLGPHVAASSTCISQTRLKTAEGMEGWRAFSISGEGVLNTHRCVVASLEMANKRRCRLTTTAVS